MADKINLEGFGYVDHENVTGNKTLDLGDSGVAQNVTANAVLTLPASVAGNADALYMIRVGAENLTVGIAPNSADKIAGGGLTAADDKSIFFTNQPVGSYIVLQSNAQATTDSAYVIQRLLGDITREA